MKTEKVFACIILVALLMKLVYIPFSGPLLVLSISTLSLFYFPLGFYFLNVNSSTKNMGLSIVAGFLLATIPVGILFKIMSWPSANQMLIAGIFSSALLFVIILVVKRINFSPVKVIEKEKDPYQKNLLEEDEMLVDTNSITFYKNLYIRTIILFSLSILFLAI